ncbi:hypothetical protein N665_1131s0003 [Sinapis alba]|nr:hypothetical protein N665_1131s0003 [Sinapis alba]
MDEEGHKTHNPNNSHERLKSWSELPSDLLNLLLERLSFTDFRQAKSVCWSWYSASRQCVPKNNHIPWLLLFPEDNNSSSCTLFNPEEKDKKLYKTQDLDLELPRIFCLKTCGSWLLMRNRLNNLYLVNLFTKERINLPHAESQVGTTKVERVVVGFRITLPNGSGSGKPMHIRSPVFWIDDKTKDYVVSWGLGTCCVVYSKKGDTSWTQIPEALDCCDMVYKDHKLYFLSYSRGLMIFDFSGEVPQQSFWCRRVYVENIFVRSPRRPHPADRRRLWATKLVVTVTGDVLKVETFLKPESKIWSFRLFKVCSLGLFKRVYSLGNEAMLLDLGITVLANNNEEGIRRNSIYFRGSHNNKTSDIFLFNLETRKMEQLHKLDCSSDQLPGSRWFLPTFTQSMA